MSEISPSQSRREAVEIALWQTPSPEPDAATMSTLSRADATSQEQVVGNVAVGDGSVLPELGPLSSFGSWENVASTLLFKTAAVSGFDQGSLDFDQVAWDNFLKKFATIPFFLTYTFDHRDVPVSALTLDNVVDAVSGLVQELMTPQNFDDVTTTIKKMAALAVRNKTEQEKESNQQLGLLSRHAGELYLGAVRTALTMRYKEGKGGYEPLQQTLIIYCGYGVLDFDKCIRKAGTLLTWGSHVNAWVGNTDSYAVPPNGSPAWTAEPSRHTSSRLAV